MVGTMDAEEFRTRVLAVLKQKPKVAKRLRLGWRLTVFPYADTSGSCGHGHVRIQPPKHSKGKAKTLAVHLDGQKLSRGEPEWRDGHPLFRAEQLGKLPSAVVWITRNDYAATKLNEAFARAGIHEFNIATCLGNTDDPSGNDLRPLGGRDVVVWVDVSGPDRQHYEALIDELRGLAEPPRTVSYANAGIRGDRRSGSCAQWLRVRPKLTVDELLGLVASKFGVARGADGAQPQPLQVSPGIGSEYPIHALGPIMAPAAMRIAEIVHAPGAAVGQAMLAVSALATQGLKDVELHGRRSPTSIFQLVIDESGARKSQVWRIVCRAAEDHQKRLLRRFNKDLVDFRQHSELYETEKRQALRQRTPKARRKALLKLGAPPAPPAQPFLMSADPTYEGVVKNFADAHPSMGIFSDEGGLFGGGYSMGRDHARKTVAGLNALWDGTALNRLRTSERLPTMYGRRLSVFLMAQPKVGQDLTANRDLRSQGFIARFLTSRPESLMGTRRYVKADVLKQPEVQAFHKRLDEIFRIPLPLQPGSKNVLAPEALKLSDKAIQRWIRFHDEIETQLGEGGSLRNVADFASKAAEHALRVAAVLATIGDPKCTLIKLEDVKNAIALVRFHLAEASRLYGHVLVDERMTLAEETLGWLRKQPRPVVALKDVYQRGPKGVRYASSARETIQVLLDRNCIERAKASGHVAVESYIVVRNTKAFG
jgi:hypothetical protein